MTSTRTRVLAAAGLAAVLVLGTLAWRSWMGRGAPPDPHWPATARVVAGSGAIGFLDGSADVARFAEPFGVALGADGTIFVTDAGASHRIRRIAPSGAVTTMAGGARGFSDGAGDHARFDTPSGLAIDAAGVLYVADTANNAIRKIAPDGSVSTYAGDGLAGYRDGPAAQARFNGPIGIAVDRAGRVVVSDTYNDRIRTISPDGVVSTLAGHGEPGFVDGPALEARFDTPSGVAIDPLGAVYVADTGNGTVRSIDAAGTVSTLTTAFGDGLVRPIGIALGLGDGPDATVHTRTDIYVTDDRGRIVEIFGTGEARVLTGNGPGFSDGLAGEARFRSPTGIAVAAPRRLIVADSGNAMVRVIAAPSAMDLRAPSVAAVIRSFDPKTFAIEPLLWPVAPMEGPHEVAGTLGEARGGEGSERFHAGIDVRKEQGTPVLAIRDGTISSPISNGDVGTLNEWLRIGPIAYIHIRAGRERRDEVFDAERFVPSYDETGALVRIRVKRGAAFTSGEQIATVNAFNHVHLNVGPRGEEHNPLDLGLMYFEDTIPPTIARGGVTLFDAHGQPLTRRLRGRLLVSDRVQVIVDAWDQSNGNRPERRLGLYELGYQLLKRDGTPAPGFEQMRHTMRFDRLATDPNAARLVYSQGSGIPFYGRRRTRFLYAVTNTFRDGIATEGFLDTTAIAPGDYTLRILAADAQGNVATANRDVALTILAPGDARAIAGTPAGSPPPASRR